MHSIQIQFQVRQSKRYYKKKLKKNLSYNKKLEELKALIESRRKKLEKPPENGLKAGLDGIRKEFQDQENHLIDILLWFLILSRFVQFFFNYE